MKKLYILYDLHPLKWNFFGREDGENTAFWLQYIQAFAIMHKNIWFNKLGNLQYWWWKGTV
jgi:hypothetical protein